MFKHLALAAILSGCSGSIETSDVNFDGDFEFGQIEQALTWPWGYGWRNDNGQRCYESTPGCTRPIDKTWRVKFHASTCSEWWRTRVFNGYVKLVNNVSTKGWTISPPGPNDARDVDIRCSTQTPAGKFAEFIPSQKVCDPDTFNCTYAKGDIVIYVNNIENWKWFKQATDANKIIFGENVTYHEDLHMCGLGHWEGPSIMIPGLDFVVRDTDSSENSFLANFVP